MLFKSFNRINEIDTLAFTVFGHCADSLIYSIVGAQPQGVSLPGQDVFISGLFEGTELLICSCDPEMKIGISIIDLTGSKEAFKCLGMLT